MQENNISRVRPEVQRIVDLKTKRQFSRDSYASDAWKTLVDSYVSLPQTSIPVVAGKADIIFSTRSQ